MNQPQQWECELYEKVHAALKESGKTKGSYFVLIDELIQQCKRGTWQKNT